MTDATTTDAPKSDVEADISTLRSDFAELKADIAAIAQTVQSLAKHGKAEAVARAQESGKEIEDRLRQLASEATAHIENKPVASAVTTFSIGLLLGVLLSSRRL